MRKASISKRLLQLDFLAPTISLRFSGESSIKTWLGVTLTLLYIASILCFSYLILLTYFSKDSPTVVIENSEQPATHRIDFREHGLLPIFFMLRDETLYMNATTVPTYFTLQFSKYKFRTVVGSSGVPSLDFSKIEMPVVPCAELEAKNPAAYAPYKSYENDEVYLNFVKHFGLCVEPDPEESFISGLGTESQFDMLTYQVFPCSLSSECAPIEEVRRMGLAIASPSATINVADYDRPVRLELAIENIYFINEGLKQKYQPRFTKTDVLDDEQGIKDLLNGRTTRTSFFSADRSLQTNNMRYRDPAQTTCTKMEILTLKCSTYLQFEFMSTPKETKYIRIYKSLTRTMGEIGGMNSFLYIIVFYINYIHCKRVQKQVMVDKVFDFIPKTASKLKESKSLKEKGTQSKLDKSLGSELGKKEGPHQHHQQHHLTDDILGYVDGTTIKTMKKDAFCMIEETIDICTIVKDMMNLKILLNTIMKDYHKSTASLVSFRSLQDEKINADGIRTDFNSSIAIIKNIKLSMSCDISDKQSQKDCLDHRMDKFFSKKLLVQKMDCNQQKSKEDRDLKPKMASKTILTNSKVKTKQINSELHFRNSIQISEKDNNLLGETPVVHSSDPINQQVPMKSILVNRKEDVSLKSVEEEKFGGIKINSPQRNFSKKLLMVPPTKKVKLMASVPLYQPAQQKK